MNETLKTFLDKKVAEYNQPSFIAADPISVPHRFSKKEDIEIAGFFASIFAWGNRTTIINKTTELMKLMDDAPHDFIVHHSDKELQTLLHFKHRTFNATDLLYFLLFLGHHYKSDASLETAFTKWMKKEDENIENAVVGFHDYFFSLEDAPVRTKKHIATPARGSTCKRLCMFLRWMVRSDDCGVDFGLWKKISPSQLVCPVDVHVGRVARQFNLITRKQTDWTTAVELTRQLKTFDASDPVKYDFALFGLGVMQKPV
ncbi:TIGR02757 family protein [Flavisolibacter ginsenosidimutans]|uniref:TIGR02757 family protein n=1 Tax=Flavisolibacter ginsenosidimutans TaxID=661481 RepID=A0A5B8UN63_9BACT|nr:TIGR02757 family protein [Flavisolibacter ginsenosidimutans]QEC57520.1 TIGR02757 family protein [Flavisolibacter ginsenosidimutans]